MGAPSQDSMNSFHSFGTVRESCGINCKLLKRMKTEQVNVELHGGGFFARKRWNAFAFTTQREADSGRAGITYKCCFRSVPSESGSSPLCLVFSETRCHYDFVDRTWDLFVDAEWLRRI